MNQPTISIIAALSENKVIGNKGKIPWHIREDLIRFKEKTAGHATIIGRKTFESLIGYYKKSGRPWPNRTHIIVTSDHHYSTDLPQTVITHSFESALEKAKQIEKEEIFIAGGAQIFTQGIKYADKLYLTTVKGNFEGDAFFPDYSTFTKIVFKQDSEAGNLKYSFIDLEKDGT